MDILLIAIYFTIVFILFQTFKFISNIKRKRQMMKNIPGPPVDSFILGSTQQIFCPAAERMNLEKERFQRYGGIYCYWVMSKPVVVLASAENAELFFNSKYLDQKSDFYKPVEEWLGQGLILNNGSLWLRHRKLITPAFHFSILNSFCETFVDNTLHLIEKIHTLPEEKTFNVYNIMSLISLENICETAMGFKLNALNNPTTEYIMAIEKLAETAISRQSRPWTWNDRVFKMTPEGQKMVKNLHTVHSLAKQVIQDKENALKNKTIKDEESSDEIGREKKLAFLDVLFEACDSDLKPFTKEELKDEVNTFMFAGHETTAASLSWTLFLLGNHPEIQEKCFQELDTIFQGSDRRLTMNDIKEMKYLEQVIKESLRLFPSVPRITRKSSHDFKLGDYEISKDAVIFLNLFFLHRDPKFFPDPEKFDPERFSKENCANRHPYAYIPFAVGSRNCIGQKYALLELKVVLSYILRNFSVESMYSLKEINVRFEIVTRSKRSIDMRFKSRKKTNSTLL